MLQASYYLFSGLILQRPYIIRLEPLAAQCLMFCHCLLDNIKLVALWEHEKRDARTKVSRDTSSTLGATH